MDLKKTKVKKASAASKETQAKRWLFTLNNYNLDDPQDMINLDLTDYCVMGREVCPTTGTPHIQGYAIFKNPTRMSQLKKILPRAHWTKAKGTPQQNRTYCMKDGLAEEYGAIPTPNRGTTAADRDIRRDEISSMALDTTSVSDGMAILKRELPYDFLRFGESMERNLKRSKSQTFVPTHALATFNRAPLVFNRKSVLLWGPSNTGKTSYALAHFKAPLLVSHIDVLKSLSPDNDGIVFDDMAFKHWPVEAVIHLLDYDLPRDINVRYGTVNIPKEVLKIFTHNTENPFYDPDTIEVEQKAAIERRFERIHVLKGLY